MPEITLREYENEIDRLIEDARYLEALAHIRQLLGQYPRYTGAYYLLGKTLLEADQPALAVDAFQRALNADPDYLLARIGLGLAHERCENINAAIWNLERALELSPGNKELADELRRLYGRRDGLEPSRIPLSRLGLAHLYIRGHHYSRAVEELRTLLTESPERLDVLATLAEAHWRADQTVQAADTCQQVLDKLRYCLKPNLLLGTLWVNSGQEEGQLYLNRAQEVDPENRAAVELLGAESPLELREVWVDRLVYNPDAIDVDREAEWFRRLEAASVTVGISEAMPEVGEADARLEDITTGLESQIELPDWLREMGVAETGASSLGWMADLGMEEQAEAPSAGALPVLDWLPATPIEETEETEVGAAVELSGIGEPGAEEEIVQSEQALEGALPIGEEGIAEPGEGMAAEALPDWLSVLEEPAPGESVPVEAAPGEAEMPDWLNALAPVELQAEGEPAPAAAEIPSWLKDTQPLTAAPESVEAAAAVSELGEEAILPAVSEPAPETGIPDWLASLAPAAVDLGEEIPSDEIPEWLRELQSAGVAEAETGLVAEAGDIPDWLRAFEPSEAEAQTCSSWALAWIWKSG